MNRINHQDTKGTKNGSPIENIFNNFKIKILKGLLTEMVSTEHKSLLGALGALVVQRRYL